MLRVRDVDGQPDPTRGRVRWSPAKSLFVGGMTVVALALGIPFFTPEAFVLFIVLSGVTLCCGHSVGIHRGLIHGSYRAPRWLRRLLVYLGTLVGLGGPLGLVRMHDTRDWAQRQPRSHDFFGHRRGLLVDYVWQIHCRLDLERPPSIALEPELADDLYLRWLDRTWMLQQVPVALVLVLLGGLPFVVWGVCARVALGVTGHWFVGHLVHNGGRQHFHIEGASVQGYNSRLLGALSMGEGWHNNHHVYPGSARIGLHRGELDPGWIFLRLLEHLGLARNLRTPQTHPCDRHPRAVPTTRW